MGEGNWRIARGDRPVRLIDRPLGIGRLDNPPTLVFGAVPGAATTAALVALEGERWRLVVARGEVLDTEELPQVEMHHFHFRPDAGMEPFMDRWLALGAPHHFVLNLGDHRARWRRLAEQWRLELVEL
jgi:L-arabinose isomerase